MFLSEKDLRFALTLGVGVGLIYLAMMPPAIVSIDGTSMFAVAISLVTKHNFTVPSSLGILGIDGFYYSNWYPLLSVLSVPFVALGLALGSFLNLPTHCVAAVCALTLQVLLTAVTTSFVALLSLQLGSGRREAMLAAIAYALGTIVLVYTRTFFAEPLAACITAAGLYFAFGKTKRKLVVLCVLSALAVLAKPTGAVLGVVLAGYLWVKNRKVVDGIIPLIGMTIGVLILGVYNQMRFGNPISSGQPWAFGHSNVVAGVLGLLFSPGAGLIWYCPPTILFFLGFHKLLKINNLELFTTLIFFLSYLFLHSLWKEWYGGDSWGPRFLMPALPGLFAWLGLIQKKWRKWVAVLTVIGFLVNAPTLVSFFQRFYAEAGEQGVMREALLWSPRHAPIVQGWGIAYRTVREALETDVNNLVGQIGPLEDRFRGRLGRQVLSVVALWWWMLPALGISRWIGALASLLLIGTGLRMLRDTQSS